MPFVGRNVIVGAAWASVLSLAPSSAQEPTIQAIFRSAVDMVSMTAVVRDRHGRVVSSLSRDDFQVIDAGQPRQILDLRSETAAPASVALLVDGSGSMRGSALDASRRIADEVLDSLNPSRDDAALFSFDTRLIELHPFTSRFDDLRGRFASLGAWGSTSLYDAIAGTAGKIAGRDRNRRAVIVLTDGLDNASVYTPEEVSSIASTIDVPIYVFALVPSNESDAQDRTSASQIGVDRLAALANWTGGDVFVGSEAIAVTRGVQRVIEELRHQYVIAFAAADAGGRRAVEVRTRRPGLKVRSRSWYQAGQGG